MPPWLRLAFQQRIEATLFIVELNRKQLTEIGGLLEAGYLRPVVDTVLPLAEAPGVLSRDVSHGRGRVS